MQYAKPVTLNVEECDRLSFLPYLFGNDFLYAEAYVYALAQKMMPEYQGGFWHFSRHKSALVMQKYSRQQAREAEQKARAYQALVAQAEIELAFHSPETVGSWHARWSDRVAEHDLETLFWQWGERFPSLAGMERWQWQDMPFWQVIAEASLAAREAGHAVREMERWMVPNKLREAA